MRRQTYRQKRDAERAALVASGLVAEHYPGISNIEFHMIYYHRGVNRVLMDRTLNLTPADYAGFHLKCMQDGCANGGYDLAPVVAAMVRGRKKSARGTIFCRGTNDTLGHASMAYAVKIEYAKA